MAHGDHLFDCYAPPAQEFVRGEGAYLYTESGEKYLDFIAGIAVRFSQYFTLKAVSNIHLLTTESHKKQKFEIVGLD